MANTVTYDGPKDPKDPSVAYEVDGQVFKRGHPVKGVTDQLAKRLQGIEAHQFTVTKQSGGN